MPTAYVLVNTETGLEFDVVKELQQIEGVEAASPVYGAYDIVVRVSSETPEGLKRIITWQIRKLRNIRATLTNIIYDKSLNLMEQPTRPPEQAML